MDTLIGAQSGAPNMIEVNANASKSLRRADRQRGDGARSCAAAIQSFRAR
jgi:hypothetical protein